MKAAYVKAPMQFEIRDVELRELGETDVLVDVKACSVCGHDIILARYAAEEWQQFGHEIAGVVKRVGRLVANVKPGDKVVLESGTFDRFSRVSRNGRVDLDNKGPNFWVKDNDPMGFSEQMIAPCETCVPFENLKFEDACIVEPMGVALDLVKTADVKLNDDVLVIGLGPIGLMAARLAKQMGARHIFGSEISECEARISLAKKWGVEEVLCPDKIKIEDYQFPQGGVDKVLVTAPPKVFPTAIEVANVGAYIAFLGIDYSPSGFVTVDSTTMHTKKIQLRASNASPALYFPECLELIASHAVDTADLITHRFKLSELSAAVNAYAEDRRGGIKAVMVKE